MMTQPPAKYILRGNPPYTARSASDKTDDWAYWYVTDDGRTNRLAFENGAVFASKEHAIDIADKANSNDNQSRECAWHSRFICH